MELSSHPETHEITCQLRPAEEHEPGQVWMPTKVMQHVSELLEQADEPLSRNVLITTAGGNKDYAAQAIDHLERLHYITETAGPRRARLYHHTRSFTVLEWESKDNNATSPDFPRLPPAEVPHTFPHHPPPTGEVGRGEVGAARAEDDFPPALENWSWVDELTPRENEDPPHDLHHQEPT
jgi:hypothetical protein